MGRMYACTFENTTIATASGDWDFFELTPASNKPCRIVGLYLGQNSLLGDIAEKQVRLSIIRLPVTASTGTGGTTAAAGGAINATDAASGFTFEANNTGVATTNGTLVRLFSTQFNVRTGIELWLPPEVRPQFVNGTLGIVRMEAALGVDMTGASGTLYVEEEG